MIFPEKLSIRWMPDLHTSHVGRFNGSDQFLLAQHNVPTGEHRADEYVALYCFDSSGKYTSHEIAGPLDHVTDEAIDSLLARLGSYEFADIRVAPFKIAFDGLFFGLIPDPAHGTITLEPGSMITFMEPWDGEYYT